MELETISDHIIEMTKANGDAVFCHFLSHGKTQAVTRKEFLNRASAFAQSYGLLGIKKGGVVIIILGHHLDTYCSFVGAMLIGAIPSFLPLPSAKQDPEIYWATHKKLLARIEAQALVTTREGKSAEQIPNFPTTKVIYAEDVQSLDETNYDWEVGQSADIAFLQHSSGTTGLKKGVVLTHQSVLNNIDTYAQVIGLGEKDIIVSWLPLYHDMGLITSFLMPMVHGIPFVTIDPFEWVMRPTMLLEALEVYRGTFAWLPNFAFHHIVNATFENDRWDLSSVRALISCSEPCKPQTMEEFAHKFAAMGLAGTALQTCYAMAENVFAVTQSSVTEAPRIERKGEVSQLSCGRALPGVEIKIIDGSGATLEEGSIGEILLKAKTLFDGYFKLPDESRKTLKDGWYSTGDLGYLSKGDLYVTGRKKDLLIIRGINFYAHDVEYAANQVSGLIAGRCVALGVYDDTSASEEAVLIAETEISDAVVLKGLKRQIKEQIFSHTTLIIKSVEFVPKRWLIKTTSGKIDRSQNLRKYHAMKAK
ncbi:MAG: AMP-binding protein [Rhodospirillales bacterium]|nr:AMP-binding protein [Rhodospirillales bacterium]